MEKAKKVWQTTLKNGQDKKSATSKASGTFESRRKASAEEAGNPLFLGEETVEKTDKRQRRYIRIRDQTLWEKIDRIMEEEKYKKSFNKVINDALYFGLDELMRHLFEREETIKEEQEEYRKQKLIRKLDGVNEVYFMEIAKLLKEVIINVIINKSLLSSIFNEKLNELNGEQVSGKKLEQGEYAETPKYLEDYEIEELKDLRI